MHDVNKLPSVANKVTLDARSLVTDQVSPERRTDQLFPSSRSQTTVSTARLNEDDLS